MTHLMICRCVLPKLYSPPILLFKAPSPAKLLALLPFKLLVLLTELRLESIDTEYSNESSPPLVVGDFCVARGLRGAFLVVVIGVEGDGEFSNDIEGIVTLRLIPSGVKSWDQLFFWSVVSKFKDRTLVDS